MSQEQPAPSPTPAVLSLHDAVGLGLQHSFDVRIASSQAQSATDQVGQKRMAFLPDVSASVANSEVLQQRPNPNYSLPSALPGPTIATVEQTANVDASYVLLSSTRRLDLQAAQLGNASKRSALETSRRQLIRDVAKAYLQVVQADALLKLDEQDAARKTRGLEEAKAMVAAGRRAEFEVTRAEADLATAEATLVDARNGARLARAQLGATVGTTLPLDFTAEEPSPPADPRGPGIKGITPSLVTDSLERRTEVRSAEADAEQSRLSVVRDDRQFIPTLSLFGHYSRLVNPTAFDPYEETFNWGGQVQVRFSDVATNVWRTRAARDDAETARETADKTRAAIRLALVQASLEVDRAGEVLAANQKALQASRRNYDSVDERYRLGVASQTEKIDAEAALVAAENEAAKADVAWRTALWSLRYEMGESLDY